MPPELVRCAEQWRREPGVVTAAELVEASIVHAQEREAVNAARFLARSGSGATPIVRKHAALVLRHTGHNEEVPAHITVGQGDTAHIWRMRTRINPHDPMAWVELALAQVSLGHDEHAVRSMKVALQLAPENRHALRAAARLFVHMHEPERAHDLIRRCPVGPSHPQDKEVKKTADGFDPARFEPDSIHH